eukprot:gi/632977551/ref/XP_007905409.1/ PREDICTED: chitin-binding lectin 1-like [Callorhinchus milii]
MKYRHPSGPPCSLPSPPGPGPPCSPPTPSAPSCSPPPPGPALQPTTPRPRPAGRHHHPAQYLSPRAPGLLRSTLASPPRTVSS